MINVVGVRFRTAGKQYYFDPAGLRVSKGDHVIVETSRGLEYGTVVMEEKEMEDKSVMHPLKKIIRRATEHDEKRNLENQQKKKSAMTKCQEKIEKHGLEMKLIDAEYTFDNNKVIFYFTADGRVDFRSLVKDLASVFRMRIELRQVGVRDEAKLMGGIGNCGRGLCCHEWMRDFQPVSIRMAKTQNLSLNPSKISGICGRLMCCLNYENDLYMELRRGMPSVGERIECPDGTGVVTNSNILEQKVTCRLVEAEADLEEKTDEKLSTEVYTYDKEDVRRLERKKRERRKNGGRSRKKERKNKGTHHAPRPSHPKEQHGDD